MQLAKYLAAISILFVAVCSSAADAPKLSLPKAENKHIDAAHAAKASELINGGIRYLLSQREKDGGWSLGGGANKPAITAMVIKALLQHPDFDRSHPVVKKAFAVLLKYRQKDGGIYNPKEGMANYTTAVAVMAIVSAGDPQLNSVRAAAVKFLAGQQIVAGSESPDGRIITKKHPFFGGVSYGKHGRPDLSNLGFNAEALKQAGLPADHPYWKNAVVFLTRTQNLSETNPRPWAKKGANRGGFVYAPATKGDLNIGESKAGAGAGGQGLRSYGSMTYTGFKSLLYAGVDKKDPRVQAAYNWIRAYWRLDSNPNMPKIRSQQGLYYYYHAMAKALRAWGQPVITDNKGVKHNWRQELVDALAKRVKKDGRWENQAKRWFERMPVLVTCYSVLSLEETLKK